MARSVTVEVKGLRELGERLRTLKADVALKAARSATGAAASVVKKAAIANIERSPSIDTGALKLNVVAKRIPASQTTLTSEHIVTVRRGRTKLRGGGSLAGAPYAFFVEFGTVNMPAEPFLGPALDRNVDKATEAMVKRLKARIEKAGG